MKTYATEADLAVALELAHSVDTRALQARVERLTAVLREHELPLPGDDPRLGASDGEHLEACREVVVKAYELMQALTTLEQLIGSGVELL